jgi:hypothetical protein
VSSGRLRRRCGVPGHRRGGHGVASCRAEGVGWPREQGKAASAAMGSGKADKEGMACSGSFVDVEDWWAGLVVY